MNILCYKRMRINYIIIIYVTINNEANEYNKYKRQKVKKKDIRKLKKKDS